MIAEYDVNNTLLRKFIYGPGIDEPVCMIDVADGNKVYYYHFDGLGSVIALTDTSGTFVEYYEYDVFGEPTIWDANAQQIVESSVVGNPYMFTGRRYDDETGNYYYRARYYSPDIGRFLQTDPIGYEDGLNLYTYVGNNPVNWTDPSGLKYGTGDCSYYRRKCKQTRHWHYCYIGRGACKIIRIPWTNWDECVRQCLQEYDQQYCDDPCGRGGVSLRCIGKGHSYCFRKCFSDSGRRHPFPPGPAPL